MLSSLTRPAFIRHPFTRSTGTQILHTKKVVPKIVKSNDFLKPAGLQINSLKKNSLFIQVSSRRNFLLPVIIGMLAAVIFGSSDNSAEDNDVENKVSPNKLTLAHRLFGHSKLHEEALRVIFQGVMEELEKAAESSLDPSMKERVWISVSKDRQKILKDTLMLQFCNKILEGYKEYQIDEMLEEHQRTGSFDVSYIIRLQTDIILNKDSIIDAVIEEAKSMTDAWIPEIVEALKMEGVEFSVLK